MSEQKTRLMITGTEGNPDYLVCARKAGYVLGIKALLQQSTDQAVYGFRLRLQKATSGEDIANTKADMEGMAEVFKDIPWKKRNSTRFSTVIMREVNWGVEFTDKLIEEISDDLPKLLDEVEAKFQDGEHFSNRDDVVAYLTEHYTEQANLALTQYQEFLAASEGKQTSTGEGQVVSFPVADLDPDEDA